MKTKPLFYLAAALLLAGCNATDLTEVNGKIDSLKNEVNTLTDRVAANENAIRVLQKASANSYAISSVEEFTAADGTSGWTIYFTNNAEPPITIYNGKNGKDGEQGSTATIDVEVKENCVVFTIGDQVVEIPLGKTFNLSFDRQSLGIAGGQTETLDYTLAGGDDKTTLDYIGGYDYKVVITKKAADRGTVAITAPDPAVSDRIAIIADDNAGHTSIKVIVIDALNYYANVTDVTEDIIPAEGGTVSATVTSNIDNYTLDIDQEWLSLIETRAETTKTYTFQAEANDGFELRTVTVTVRDADNVPVQQFSFAQAGKEFDPGNGTQENPYRLRTYNDLCNLREKMVPQGNTDNPQYVYVELFNDIDCEGRSMYEVDGSGERPIHFDGKNHTVRNIGVHRMTMFGFLWGTVKNLNIENAHWNGSNYYEGGFAAGEHGGILCATVGLVGWGRNHAGHVENVHIYNSSVEYGCNPGDVGWQGSAGILCGELAYEGSSIKNCSAENCTITGDFYTGGLVGIANGKCGKVTIENCFTSGTVSSGATLPTGGDNNGDFFNPTSDNTFNVKLGYAGGIVGFAHNADIRNCYSTASCINTDTDRGVAGGIVAVIVGDTSVQNCWASGEIHSTINGGGIVGTSGFYYSYNNLVDGCIAWNDLIANAGGQNESGPVTGWYYFGTNGSGNSDTYAPNKASNGYSKEGLVVTLAGAGVDRSEFTGASYETGIPYYTGQVTSDIIGAAKVIGWDESVWDLSGELPKLFWQK